MNKTAAKALMPIIAVDSVDEARTFYVDALGFEHSMGVVGKDGQFDFVTLNREGARVMFSRTPEPANAKAKQPVQLYVQVDDVDGYHDELKKRKVRITDPLTTQWWGDRTFKVLDPNGYEIWFYETTSEPKPPEGTKIV